MRKCLLIVILVSGLSAGAAADEGMWSFNHPPTQQIKAKYHFTLTPAWLDHTRLSSVRFNNGGSGSFVSPNGLTFTNHHIAQTCLYGLSTKEHDLYKTGFYAKTQAEEAKCPDLELNVLVGMDDVTRQVNAGVTPAMSAAEARLKRHANMANIESQCVKQTALRCDVVTFYAGAMYQLYQYRKYTDVRLVFAPELQAAFFGGNHDNFEYPRYDLDIAFFRIYQDNQPVHLKNYFRWSRTGIRDHELVFVSGNPGSTARLLTMAQLRFLRDISYPYVLDLLGRRIKLLKDYAAQSNEHARQAQELLFNYENGFKAITGYESGLQEKSLMAKKEAEEEQLKQAVASNPKMKQEFDDPWAEIVQAEQVLKSIYLPVALLERASGGKLTTYAKELARGATERQKPNPERLAEYRESALPSLEQHLFSTAPVYKDLDTVLLADWLTQLKTKLPDNPVVQKVIGGQDPEALAKNLIAGTKLQDPAVRKQLWQGGEAAIQSSTDPLIVFMREFDPGALAVRKEYDDKVEAVERRAGTALAKIRFATKGLSVPPDATFTLRLSYGVVLGYIEDGRGDVAPKGTHVRYFTTMGGTYKRSALYDDKPPFDLVPSWIQNKSKVNLSTPLNFVSTPDIIGGNSGSPVIDKAGNVVGIIFDGNIQSLPWNFAYEDAVGRSVSVDGRGIIEALRHIYHANRLVDELVSPRRAPIPQVR